MSKITKNEKILRKANEKWKNFLAEGAFKSQIKESPDMTPGAMLVDLVNSGEMEWYEAAPGDSMEELMKHVNSGAIEDFDAAQLAQFGIDAEDVEFEWNKAQGLKEWDEDDTYHFDQDKHGPEEEYTAAANFKMGDVVKVMNRGKPKFDEPEELRCRIGTVVGMDGMNLTLKFENGEEATITYFNARRDEHGLWDSKNLYNCPEQVSEGVEPREGDYVNIIGGVLTGAVGKVIELTTTGGIGIEGGLPAIVVRLTKAADKPIYGGKGDEVIVQPKFVEVDSGLYGAQVNEARMGEYGKIDAEDGNPPTKIGRGNEEYMAAYNAVLVARGEKPLDIQKPDQAYLDALRSGQLQETVRKVVTKFLTEKKTFKLKEASGARTAEAVNQIERILNDLYDDGVDNATLVTLLKQIIVDIGRGYVGQPSESKIQESNMEMSLQSKAKGKAMGLLQTAKAMAKAPSTEPAKGFAAAVANAAGEIVDLMVELEGFQASRSASLQERDAGMETWMEKFKLHARLPQNQPMDEFMKDNAMYAYRQGMDPKQAAEELRKADAERDFPESGMELYDIDEKKNLKEEVIEDFEIELEDGLTFADVEEAGLITPGVDSVIDNGDGYAQVYSEPKAMAKMAKTLQAMTGVMVSPKSHGPVDEKNLYTRTTRSSDPELDQIEDIAKDMLEAGIQNARIPVGLMSVASALNAQGFDATVSNGVLNIDGKYFMGKKGNFDISPDEDVRQVMGYVLGYKG